MADQVRGQDAEQLAAQVRELRSQLLVARDAAIGAEAELGSLKVRNRELEVLVGQLRQALAAQTRWDRLVGRATGNRYVSALIDKAKATLRP